MDYDPIRLEVFKNLLSGIAEEMGVTLSYVLFAQYQRAQGLFMCAL